MICRVCNVDVHPFQSLVPGRGMIAKCPRCNGGMPDAESEVETTSDQGEAVAQVAPVPVPQTSEHAKPVDILAVAKARLAVVDQLIASLRDYEAEQALLRRMIAAAEPSAEVIPLRKQG